MADSFRAVGLTDTVTFRNAGYVANVASIGLHLFATGLRLAAPVIIWKVRRYASPRLIGSIAPQLLSAVLTGVLLHHYASYVDNFFLLVVAAFIGGVVYMLCMSFMRGEMLAAELENMLGSIAPRSERLGAVLRILSKLINAVYYRRLLGRS